MGTVIILLIIVVIVAFALKNSLKHLKGEGGCCGGGGTGTPEKTKILENPVIKKKIIHVEGMHCENCKNSIERQINRIDGASCTVNLKKKIAVVSCDREIDEELLCRTIRNLDFKVKEVETEEVSNGAV
jgi:copper chaperone CopZ